MPKPLETPDQLESLDTKELEALQEKSCGLTDDQAGKNLKISGDGVAGRLRSVYEKLGYNENTEVTKWISNRACRAVCIALRAGKIAGPYKGPIPPSFTEEDELKLLRLIAFGFSNRQISKYLEISEEAVRSRVKTASAKCGTTSRTQLVATAIVHNLI